jgi:hypothetical protein
MENNSIVPRIIEVLVTAPLGNRSVNLNVTSIGCPADANHCAAKIRSAVSIERSHIKNLHRLILGSLERQLLDVLPSPDVAEKPLVDIKCALAQGMSNETGDVLQSKDGWP